jgi:beta-glucanase (GH16 family)
MKSNLVKFRDRVFKNLALTFSLSVFLVGCGGQDTTNPKSYDIYKPVITLNSPGADAIVETSAGTQHIPTEDICYVVGEDDCVNKTVRNKNVVHYMKLDTEIDQVISITSEDFTDIAGVNFSPEGTQTTVVTVTDSVAYTSLDFQSTTFPEQDISKKTSLHIDFYSDNITQFELSIIDATGVEDTFSLMELINNGHWVSTDIQLNKFTQTNKSIINEIKIVGNGSLQFKNLYFHGQMVPQSVEGVITGYFEDHKFGDTYSYPGAVARDIYDSEGDVTIDENGPVRGDSKNPEIIPVGDAIGVYTYTYTAEDESGNTSTLNRVVNVVDKDAPSITLVDGSAIILGEGSVFTDPGAIANDNIDGDMELDEGSIRYELIVSADVKEDVTEISTASLADYEATYQFEDSSGNTSSISRRIIVAPPEGEIIDIIKDGAIGATWDAPISAFDQDLNWESCQVPSGCPNIDWAFENDTDLDSDGLPRGDVLEVTHAETERLAGVIIASTTGVNILSATAGFLKFDLKIIEGGPGVTFKTDCGHPCAGVDQFHTVSELNKWETVIVPISSLRQGGLELGNIKAALVINGTDVQSDDTLTRFRLDNVSFDCRADTCAGIEPPVVLVDWAATHEDPSDPIDTTPTSYEGYTLAWSDEFDGNTVNTDNWSFDIGNGENGWGNGELQYYRGDNASVEDGLLIIEATKHQPRVVLEDNKWQYTSSKLISEGKVEFKYGRVDIRAVVAKGQGMWSAGWMLGVAGQDENGEDIAWPYRGEIDIFDTIGGTKDGVPQEGMIVNNMYWNGNGANPSTVYSPSNINNNDASAHRINDSNEGTTFSNKFHTYSLIWDEDNIEFLLDGERTQIIDISEGALAETYNNPFYLILNVAIGGDWPGSPDETTTYPDGMLVDYVRVYQADTNGDGTADYEPGDSVLNRFPN